ncbi:LysR substrate-binding domain-containing protein [Oleispirillum naphthae]|uniref:LysR substrate-binding domain-containing protein n=1 Tax=Oleispirillum naphthae TaxID=2838853 RepID=UPI0030824123
MELVAQRHRHGILQVGAPHLEDALEFLRLGEKRILQLAQIDGEPFIMYSPEARYVHDLLANAFQSAGVHPRYIQFMKLAQAILAMVSTGLGIAIVQEDTRNACFDNVVLRPISLGNNITANLHALWLGDNHNPALPAVCDLVRRLDKPPE